METHVALVSLPDSANQHRTLGLLLALGIGELVLGADLPEGDIELGVLDA